MKLHFYDQYGNIVTNLTQWDSNVILKLRNYKYDAAPVVHFANTGGESSYTVRSTLDDKTVSVVVPNILLKTGNTIIDVFVFQYDNVSDEGRALYHFTLPVTPKPKPDDYEYVDNTDIIEISTLGLRLEALIAEAEETVDVKINALESAYNATVEGIKADIADNVRDLNETITANRDKLETDVSLAVQTMLASVEDGSPRGVFAEASELVGEQVGVYLLVNALDEHNGWVYYWNGEALSDPLVYYAGTVLNRGDVHFENLDASLQKRCIITVIQFTLDSENWEDGQQTIDLSPDYTVTANTLVDINQDIAMYQSLQSEGCFGIYVVNNAGTLTAYAMGQSPTSDLTVQLTIQETL